MTALDRRLARIKWSMMPEQIAATRAPHQLVDGVCVECDRRSKTPAFNPHGAPDAAPAAPAADSPGRRGGGRGT